ncbi:hypothetical protein PIB30_073141 [Stylosanthes scabra]|uniref:Protein kinase domain-containing protein n=1 Tax=Stylosanthes scabra TaxID=79078 RepID=A0ABU6QQH5_9FABA|nr:hypothetical protein [Stylosanthes scabra]
MAYEVIGGGYKFWNGDLFDVRLVKQGGQDLYIRMPASKEQGKEQLQENLLLATSAATTLMKIGDFGFARSLKVTLLRKRASRPPKPHVLEFDIERVWKVMEM